MRNNASDHDTNTPTYAAAETRLGAGTPTVEWVKKKLEKKYNNLCAKVENFADKLKKPCYANVEDKGGNDKNTAES